MKDHTRRSLAYIAGRLISKEQSSTIFDHSCFKYFSFSGDVTMKRINIYDYDMKCNIQGLGGDSSINLYHSINRDHIYLNVDGMHFNGFDYDSGSHFSGDVRELSVIIFDYEYNKDFEYSI